MDNQFQKVNIALNFYKSRWVLKGVEQILYHCLKSICELENLSYAVQFVTEECSPYLPIGKEGETTLFHDIKVHQQEELRQLYARNNLGSGVASGARPNGPTALPYPKEANEGYNLEVVVTTIVTEYVGEALYPRATAGLEEKRASVGKNAHGHRVGRLPLLNDLFTNIIVASPYHQAPPHLGISYILEQQSSSVHQYRPDLFYFTHSASPS